MSDSFYARSDPICASLELSLHENRDLAAKLLEDVAKTEELLISLHKQLKKAKEFTSALDNQLNSRRGELNMQYKQLAEQYGVPIEQLSVIDTLLSDELYLAIFTYFDYTTLTEISTVNKKWLILARDNSLWLALFIKTKDKYVPESVREQDRKRRAAQEERQKSLTALSGLHKHKRRITADKRGTDRPKLPCYYAHWHHYFADRMRVHSWVWPETVAPRNRREAVGFGAPEPGWALALEDCALSQLRHGRVDLFDKLTVVLADVQHDLNKNSNILTTDGLNCDQHEQWADSLSLKAQTKTPFDAALLCERAVDKYLAAVKQFEDKYLASGDSSTLQDTSRDSPVRLLTSKHDYRQLVDSLFNERELHAHVGRYLTRVNNVNNVNINNTNQPQEFDAQPPKIFDFSTALTAVNEELSGTDTTHTSFDLTPVTSSSFDFTSSTSGEQIDSVNQLSFALKFSLKMESAPTSPATSGGSWKKKRVKQRRLSLGEWSTQPKPPSRTHDALTSPRAATAITSNKTGDKKSDLAVIRKHVILTFKLASTVIRLAELLATQFSTQSNNDEIGFVLALYHMAELLCTRLITVLHTDWLQTTWSRGDDTDTTASTSSSGSIGTSDEFRCLSGNNSPRSDPGDVTGVNVSLGKSGPLDFQQESYCFYCGIRKNQYFSLKAITTLALLHERRAKLLQQLLKEEAQSHVTAVHSPRQHSPRSRSAHNSPLSSPRVTGPVTAAGRSRQLSFLLTVLRQYETFAALRTYLHTEYDAARLVSEYLGAISEERVHELSGRELNHATFCLQQVTALDVADHQSLFELARIYAVMGHEADCEKVLARCATGDKCSGPLDLDDFDKYRHTPWFRHVVQVQRPSVPERLDHVTLNLPGLPEEPAQNRKMFKAKKRVNPFGTIPEYDGKSESEPK